MPQSRLLGNSEKIRLNNEKLLIKKFQDKYPVKYGRPSLNISEGPIKIGLRVQLIQIVKVVCSRTDRMK